MSDRELLELAAKAAGLQVCEPFRNGEFRVCGPDRLSFAYSPLTDDGDALRLAVKLRFGTKDFAPTACDDIQPVGMIEVWQEDHSDPIHVEWYKPGDDRYAATRRAIVRAGAEMGRQMKE